ncbi:MAG: sporulation integral membrane protein YlbJ [Clostridiales bacterium]|jgi:sporulation integral membrane protein YlbJ|nr:sporulation integral membrane protein YlbJ [Clostridiales bacterium]
MEKIASGTISKPDTKKMTNIIIPVLVLLFNIFILISPNKIISGAKQGIDLWLNTVFPSLFPFMVGVNILGGLGVINYLGRFLQPVMQPLFGVRGQAGFALAAGFICGCPIGAKTTCDMLQNGQLTKDEAQCLLCFVNNAGPIFILGAVGTGMFKSASAGYLLIAAHYIAAILNGLLLSKNGFNRKGGAGYVKNIISLRKTGEIKTFGQILSESVKDAMETILHIGGFLILFSVIIEMIVAANVFGAFSELFSGVLSLINFPPELLNALLTGIVEMTNGAKNLSPFGVNVQNLSACAAVISFGGFSIHAQTVSFLYKAELNVGKYFAAKVLHAIIAAALCYVLFPVFC